MAQEKDQRQNLVASKEEPTFMDGFDSKWEEMMSIGKEESTPKKAGEVEAKSTQEEPCEGCDKDKKKQEAKAVEQRKPYKVLKVDGKEFAVYSEEELIEKAQLGAHVAQKRFEDKQDRAKWEDEYSQRHQQLTDLAEKYERLVSGGANQTRVPAQELTQKQPEQVTRKALYEEYGIDPDYADAFQKKMIDDQFGLHSKITDYETKLQQVESLTNRLILKDVGKEMFDVIKTEREKFPFDEIMSEDGTENLTQKHFASLLVAKNNEAKAQGRKLDIVEACKQAVRDVHYIQSKSKTNAAPDISNELDPADFATRYPDLYKKVEERIKGQAVADYESDKSKLPPSLETKRQEVDISKIENKKKSDNLNDYIDEGFNTPEMRALFSGG